MEKIILLLILGMATLAQAQIHPSFPAYPPAKIDFAYLQSQLAEIGAQYCKDLLRAESVLSQIPNPKSQELLKREILVGSKLCQNESFMGFKETPDDKNIRVVVNFELLQIVTFKIFVLYKEVPQYRAVGLTQFNFDQLRRFSLLHEPTIIKAYESSESQNTGYPQILSEISDWVREMHGFYASI